MSNQNASFFKVLSNVDYIKLLRLPPNFLRKYELTLPENVKLRGDDSGRRWNVKVERMDNGLICFTNGWEKFVEDAALKFGEFLVFSLLATSEFNVVIYETNCCTREIPNPSSSLIESNAHGVKVESKDMDESESNSGGTKRGRKRKRGGNPLYFETCLKRHHKSRISLPKEFSVANNMKMKKQVRMEFVGNPDDVAVDPRPQAHRVDLAKGWPQFRVANGLVYGKTIYRFEFNPNDQLIYVKQVPISRN